MKTNTTHRTEHNHLKHKHENKQYKPTMKTLNKHRHEKQTFKNSEIKQSINTELKTNN